MEVGKKVLYDRIEQEGVAETIPAMLLFLLHLLPDFLPFMFIFPSFVVILWTVFVNLRESWEF